MRLIDADALHAATCAECTLQGNECLGDDYCDWDSIYHINHAPTIDAIPVEWLREKANGNDFLIGRAARFILHAWEWENNPSPTCGPDYCDID